MPFIPKELHYIPNFDLRLIDGKERKKDNFRNKYLIVLDVDNKGQGLYALTCSLTGDVAKLSVPYLNSECTQLPDGQYFKFPDNNVTKIHKFKKQTYVKGVLADVFYRDRNDLAMKYNKSGNTTLLDNVHDGLYVKILECLSNSEFLAEDTCDRLAEICNAEKTKLKAISTISQPPLPSPEPNEVASEKQEIELSGQLSKKPKNHTRSTYQMLHCIKGFKKKQSKR